MVAEFGVPASRGKTHDDINSGFNQGFHDESEQGEAIKSMLEDIYDEEYFGALIFTWQDEWFKRTWNTMDLNIGDRRPFWSDIQTNEQNFGLLSFDPGEEPLVYVDGKIDEWKDEDKVSEVDDVDLYTRSDEKYLYIMIKSENLDVDRDKLYIAIDSLKDQGNTGLRESDIEFERGTDFLIEIDGKDKSRILVDSYYDSHYYTYGEQLGMLERNSSFKEKDSGIFNRMRLCLSKEIYLPEDDRTIAFDDYETGKLKYGNGNPKSEDYNSLTDFSSGKDNIELRIPWQLLNFMDPSTRSVMNDFYKVDNIEPIETEGIYIGASMIDGINLGTDITMSFYSWDKWELPKYHERLKKSYYIVKDAFENID